MGREDEREREETDETAWGVGRGAARQRTDIGRVVGNLRKHTDAGVSAAARDLVNKWKKLLPATPSGSGSASASASGSPAVSRAPSVAPAATPTPKPTPTPAAATGTDGAVDPNASQDLLSPSASQDSLAAASSAFGTTVGAGRGWAGRPSSTPFQCTLDGLVGRPAAKIDPVVTKRLKDAVSRAQLSDPLRSKMAELLGDALLVNIPTDDEGGGTLSATAIPPGVHGSRGLGGLGPAGCAVAAVDTVATAALAIEARKAPTPDRHPTPALPPPPPPPPSPPHSSRPALTKSVCAAGRGCTEAFVLANRDWRSSAYKDKVRSLVSNLRHADNADLRWRVISGELTAVALCAMSRIVRRVLRAELRGAGSGERAEGKGGTRTCPGLGRLMPRTRRHVVVVVVAVVCRSWRRHKSVKRSRSTRRRTPWTRWRPSRSRA